MRWTATIARRDAHSHATRGPEWGYDRVLRLAVQSVAELRLPVALMNLRGGDGCRPMRLFENEIYGT